MPNHVKREQEMLNKDQLSLSEQSRHPALARLDDPALYDLLEQLRRARDEAKAGAKAGADANDEPARMMTAGIRRVEAERRKRGLPARREAASAIQATAPTASTVAAIAPAAAKTATKRKRATVSRKPAGRKSAESRKTDLRTEPHRVPKRRTTPPAPAAEVEAPAEDLPPVPASVPAEASTAGILRKARKEADKVARKAAKKVLKEAESEAAKAERKAAKKAAKEAQKAAEKAERKAARKAAGTAETPKAAKSKGAGKKAGVKGKAAKGAGAKSAKADPAKTSK